MHTKCILCLFSVCMLMCVGCCGDAMQQKMYDVVDLHDCADDRACAVRFSSLSRHVYTPDVLYVGERIPVVLRAIYADKALGEKLCNTICRVENARTEFERIEHICRDAGCDSGSPLLVTFYNTNARPRSYYIDWKAYEKIVSLWTTHPLRQNEDVDRSEDRWNLVGEDKMSSGELFRRLQIEDCDHIAVFYADELCVDVYTTDEHFDSKAYFRIFGHYFSKSNYSISEFLEHVEMHAKERPGNRVNVVLW